MLFPNLSVALDYQGRTQVFLADVLRVSEASLSRKLNGRSDFAPHEKTRVAEALHFSEDWLFARAFIPREAARETAIFSPGESARLDVARRVTSRNWTGNRVYDSLPPKFLRVANRWRHTELDVWPNPVTLLNEVLSVHGRETYRLACEFTVATLRKRFGSKPGYFCQFIFYPAGLCGIEPSPRPNEDVLCSGEGKGVLHPLKEQI